MFKKILILVVTCFLIFVSHTLYEANLFKEIDTTDHTCLSIGPIEGPEDLKAIGNQLLISSTSLEKTSPRGGLYILGEDFELKALDLGISFDFYPHGIDVLPVDEGKYRVYVVNHRYDDKSTVEIFEYQNAQMKHLKTIESPYFYNLNDVVALDENRFFVSQDHYFQNSYLKFLENLFRLGLGKVFYHDGLNPRPFLEGFRYTNGLHLDKTLGRLYVASMIGKKIQSFQLTTNTVEMDAKLMKTFTLDFFPDNLTPSPKGPGYLLIGAHPRILALRQHSKNPQKDLAPSVIKQLNLETGDLIDIFSDDGRVVSGASAAVNFNQRLVVGNIFQMKLSICDVE